MPRPDEDLRSVRRLARPFGHARLVGFFVAVGRVAGGAGALAGGAAAAPVAAASAAGLGLAGVLLHRLRINRIRWKETAEFLARIQRESQRYRALLEGAADMLLVVEPESGVVRECNALARRELSLEPGGGVPVGELFEPRAREALAELLAGAAAGRAAGPVSELLLRSPGGAPRLADARAAAIRFGAQVQVLLSLRDVTRQKALERELQTRERLSSIGLMTAGVAHDINNPLEGVANYLALLARPGLSEGDRARYLERVTEGFERIRGLTRELLRFARPEGGRDRVDLREVVENARRLASFAPEVEPGRVHAVGLDAPLLVPGDAARLEQVVFNLVTNAATAIRGGRGTRIELAAARVRDDAGGEWVELRCADDGPGLAPEELDRVFDPFYSRTGGAGLGLSVCYATLLAHGGTLSASNRAGGGAELRMRLPAAGEDPAARDVREAG
jgi:signal transduction histidine kinase